MKKYLFGILILSVFCMQQNVYAGDFMYWDDKTEYCFSESPTDAFTTDNKYNKNGIVNDGNVLTFDNFKGCGVVTESLNLKLVGKSNITNGIEFSLEDGKINISGSGTITFNYIGLSGNDIIYAKDSDSINKAKKYISGNYILAISDGNFLLTGKDKSTTTTVATSTTTKAVTTTTVATTTAKTVETVITTTTSAVTSTVTSDVTTQSSKTNVVDVKEEKSEDTKKGMNTVVIGVAAGIVVLGGTIFLFFRKK